MSDTKDKNTSNGLPLRAVPVSLFPTLLSLDAVCNLATSQLPITSANDMYSLLMTYHNTLLAVIERESVTVTQEMFDTKERRTLMDRRIRQGLPSNKE